MIKIFFNDGDGLTLVEAIAIIIIITWIGVTGWILYNPTETAILFYKDFIWMPMTVVGGLFGQGITNQVIQKK